jgi:putative thiamine transport system permease protein
MAAIALVLPAAEAVATRPAWRGRIAALLIVPLLVPQLAFLFGWQVLLVRAGLDGTWLAVAWSQLLFALPYVWGVLAPARADLDPRLVLAARTLGASPLGAWWRVTVPLLGRALLVAAALGVAVSAAVYLPTFFAGAGRVATLATEAAAATAAGNLPEATVLSAWQMLPPFVAFGLALVLGAGIYRRRRGVPA